MVRLSATKFTMHKKFRSDDSIVRVLYSRYILTGGLLPLIPQESEYILVIRSIKS